MAEPAASKPSGPSDSEPQADTPSGPAAVPVAAAVPARPAGPGSPTELFVAFTRLAMRGFGGVLPWAQRELVEVRGWLSREDFVEMLALGQLLPGPNVCNLALMIGDRYFGWRGALAALGGILIAPAALMLSVIALYAQVSTHPVVRQTMAGMAAVAAGLILATGAKLALAQRKRWRWLAFGLAAFVMVGVLRWPLALTLALVVPVAFALAWRAESR